MVLDERRWGWRLGCPDRSGWRMPVEHGTAAWRRVMCYQRWMEKGEIGKGRCLASGRWNKMKRKRFEE